MVFFSFWGGIDNSAYKTQSLVNASKALYLWATPLAKNLNEMNVLDSWLEKQKQNKNPSFISSRNGLSICTSSTWPRNTEETAVTVHQKSCQQPDPLFKFCSYWVPANPPSVNSSHKLTCINVVSHAGWRYQVSVTLSGQKVTGHILVSLFGNGGNSQQYEIFKWVKTLLGAS